MSDYPTTEAETLPKDWMPSHELLTWLRQRMMVNNPDFVLKNWDCKYVNMRIDMRTGQAIASPGNTHAPEPSENAVAKEVREAYRSQLRQMYGSTHYDNCWHDHWACVLDKLLKEIDRLTSPGEPSGDALDAAKWRALRNCARITAMGAAGVDATYMRDDACHVTLNLWTHNEPETDDFSRRWLDQFVAKAMRLSETKEDDYAPVTELTDYPRNDREQP